MQHALFASWIPTHYPLTTEVLNNVNEILKSFSNSVTATKEKQYHLSRLSGIKRITTRPDEMFILIDESGLFFAEKISKEIIDHNVFRRNASLIYEESKGALHIHMFSHVLSGRFPVVSTFKGNVSNVVKLLGLKYLDELTRERIKLSKAKIFFVTHFSDVARSLRSWKGTISYSLRGLPHLLRLKAEVADIFIRTSDVAGIQTFINAYRKLTSKFFKSRAREVDFLEAQEIYHRSIQELGEVIGSYTLQSAALSISLLAFSLSFFLAFYFSISPAWTLLGKSIFLVKLAALYYMFGYLIARRMGSTCNKIISRVTPR